MDTNNNSEEEIWEEIEKKLMAAEARWDEMKEQFKGETDAQQERD